MRWVIGVGCCFSLLGVFYGGNLVTSADATMSYYEEVKGDALIELTYPPEVVKAYEVKVIHHVSRATASNNTAVL